MSALDVAFPAEPRHLPEKILDYGLGTFDRQPLVLMSGGECYHLHDHGGRVHVMASFTEEFCLDGLDLRPCSYCFDGRARTIRAAIAPGEVTP